MFSRADSVINQIMLINGPIFFFIFSKLHFISTLSGQLPVYLVQICFSYSVNSLYNNKRIIDMFCQAFFYKLLLSPTEAFLNAEGLKADGVFKVLHRDTRSVNAMKQICLNITLAFYLTQLLLS